MQETTKINIAKVNNGKHNEPEKTISSHVTSFLDTEFGVNWNASWSCH